MLEASFYEVQDEEDLATKGYNLNDLSVMFYEVERDQRFPNEPVWVKYTQVGQPNFLSRWGKGDRSEFTCDVSADEMMKTDLPMFKPLASNAVSSDRTDTVPHSHLTSLQIF